MPKSNLPNQLGLPFGDHFDNRGMLAPHFLKGRLPSLPQWTDSAGMDAAFAAITQLYRNRLLEETTRYSYGEV